MKFLSLPNEDKIWGFLMANVFPGAASELCYSNIQKKFNHTLTMFGGDFFPQVERSNVMNPALF